MITFIVVLLFLVNIIELYLILTRRGDFLIPTFLNILQLLLVVVLIYQLKIVQSILYVIIGVAVLVVLLTLVYLYLTKFRKRK